MINFTIFGNIEINTRFLVGESILNNSYFKFWDATLVISPASRKIFGTIRAMVQHGNIPATDFDAFRTLVDLLSPYPKELKSLRILSGMDQSQWNALATEAYRQELAPLLFSELQRAEAFTTQEIPVKEKLKRAYLTAAAQNMLSLHDAEILLNAFHQAGIPAVGLKGVYLLENVYADIGARSMTDIDLLVKKSDLPNCLAVMGELGYHSITYFDLADANLDTKHVPPMKKATGPAVELHWTLLEEDEPFTIDAEALWQRAVSAKIAEVDALSLGVEDLILHLCLHLTYQHHLNLGLRGLMDIALVIHKFEAEIDWQELVLTAQSWGAERVTALTLKLVETQLGMPIPPEVFTLLIPESIEPKLLEDARLQLLDRVRFEDHFTPDLVELSAKKGLFSKLKIGLQRVFIPRLALARIYNVPPNSPKILGLYFVRLKYLIRSYGKTLVRLQRGAESAQPARHKAEISNSLHEWMKPHKK